jgi:hypothetical protein
VEVNICENTNTTKENPDLLGDNKEVGAEVNAEKPQNRPVFTFSHHSAGKYLANYK